MRAVVWVLFGLVFAIASFTNSYDKLTETKVSCGYEQMSRDDRCREIDGSSVRERSYADQRSANQTEGLISLVIGMITLVGSVIYAIIAIGQRVESHRGT